MEPKTTMAVEWTPTGDLFCSPANPRHNDDAVPHVAASLTRFGWRQPIVAKPSGEVIAGNTRLKAAQSLGMDAVPVVRFEGSEIEATAFAIADNRTSEFATWDEEALGQLLSTLREEDALDGIGYDPSDLDKLIQAETPEVEDAGPQALPEEAKTKHGEIITLGQHRIMCGDATNPEHVAALMGGETASLMATDPPYLVDYKGEAWDGYDGDDEGVGFFVRFLSAALPHLDARAPIYQWHATRRQALVERAWKEVGLLLHQTIIWAKARGVIGRSHCLWKHEPCFYGWVEGNQPERRPPPSAPTVWEIDQAGEDSTEHPTQKPLEVFTRPIEWHTKPGEVVYEPFSGSGSQIMAAEKLGRRCFAMELDPRYVDAAIERYEKSLQGAEA